MLPPDEPNVCGLLGELTGRGINVVGTEGAHPAWTGLGVPSLPATARPLRMFAVPDADPPPPAPAPPPLSAASPASLLLQQPVRSGQSVSFERGDVTVVGAVASGAEIMAGGSIHVYGALRGRAIAGIGGHAPARIFCARMEAELIAIAGVYLTADQVPKAFRGRAVQAMLDQQSIQLALLD
jgi:septum site-determining protein MinC